MIKLNPSSGLLRSIAWPDDHRKESRLNGGLALLVARRDRRSPWACVARGSPGSEEALYEKRSNTRSSFFVDPDFGAGARWLGTAAASGGEAQPSPRLGPRLKAGLLWRDQFAKVRLKCRQL